MLELEKVPLKEKMGFAFLTSFAFGVFKSRKSEK
jgi:hypothetical protein